MCWLKIFHIYCQHCTCFIHMLHTYTLIRRCLTKLRRCQCSEFVNYLLKLVSETTEHVGTNNMFVVLRSEATLLESRFNFFILSCIVGFITVIYRPKKNIYQGAYECSPHIRTQRHTCTHPLKHLIKTNNITICTTRCHYLGTYIAKVLLTMHHPLSLYHLQNQ